MVEITYAAKIVSYVINDGKNFVDAVDEVFPNERKNFSSNNISVRLSFHALKHFYLFEHIVNQLDIRPPKNKKCMLYVVLANNFYCRLIPVNYANGFLSIFFQDKDYVKLLPILKRKEPLEDLIVFEKDTDYYFATRYNTPVWLAHMWRKHFGDEVTSSYLDACARYDLQSFAVNTLKTNVDSLRQKYPELENAFSNILIYHGTTRYSTTPEFKNDDFFKIRIGFQSFLDDLYDEHAEMLIYSGYDDDFVKGAIVKADRKQSLNVVVPKLDKRGELMRFIRVNDVHNVNLFEANDEFSLKAGVSYKQDIVVCFPNNSRFDILATYPDYLLHFDKDNLDKLIADEYNALELCSKCVNPDGFLIYMVNTLNKKESVKVVEEFLANHPEYQLERSEQTITSDPFATTMYYAILRPGVKNDD